MKKRQLGWGPAHGNRGEQSLFQASTINRLLADKSHVERIFSQIACMLVPFSKCADRRVLSPYP